LYFSPTKGLLKIVAVGKNVDTNNAGEQLKEAFHKLQSALGETYGEAKTYDHLAAGSIWNEPRDWMMGMVKKDRELFSMWDQDGKSQDNHLSAVVLEANALNSETGYLRIIYEFVGWDEQADANKRQEDKVL
jgi:hypothetical protein